MRARELAAKDPEEPRFSEVVCRLAVAVSPAATRGDVARHIYRPSWENTVRESLRRIVDIPEGWMRGLGDLTERHGRDFTEVGLTDANSGAVRWTARSYEDGTVVLGWETPDRNVSITQAVGETWLGDPWRTTLHLVGELGGLPPVFVGVATHGPGTGNYGVRAMRSLVSRLEGLETVFGDEGAGMGRRIQRAHGLKTEEPE